MDGILNRKPKVAFDRWRAYVHAVNNNEILDGIRSQKLLNCLERIPKRKLRDATQRIAGEGDKVKGAIKKIFSTLQRMPKTAIESGENIQSVLRLKTENFSVENMLSKENFKP